MRKASKIKCSQTDSIIAPAVADSDFWSYVVTLPSRDARGPAVKYNGCRRSTTGRWNLRDLVTGSPVGWGYADDEVVVLEVLSR
ncbi:hypothetical protein [Mycobacteroides abscessus]|uniref:hypothetical protein n=1 Tax=Mycobacteroides abscessus TaxID=36809 RepID=UPI000926F4F1|nr:hypothetical protein [Mycobacteroides abscessus]SIG31183.1 Uncharacterised protein [Mycobacteroides abscessus subsp. abscessus]SIH56981.1 Uncharacterised protein [Mycobacteroides abscessus subsp. abscessus]SIM81330.1 Uncharacterised protein [Mycobacteroides abscessus subsp. abscessus]